MAEVPASFGLEKRMRSDGRIDLVGRDDTGREYVARTTEGPVVTDADVEALAVVDRERTNAREFTRRVIEQAEHRQEEFAERMLEDFMEPAERVAHAGLHRSESTVSLAGAYERGRRYFEWKKSIGLGG